MKARKKVIIYCILGYIPIAIVFTYGFIKKANIDLDLINGIIATNGIILGFWAAFLAIPRKENALLWKRREHIETGIVLTLTTLLSSVVSLSASAVGLLNPLSVLFVSVLSFYLVCWVLGITLHYTIFGEEKDKKR